MKCLYLCPFGVPEFRVLASPCPPESSTEARSSPSLQQAAWRSVGFLKERTRDSQGTVENLKGTFGNVKEL